MFRFRSPFKLKPCPNCGKSAWKLWMVRRHFCKLAKYYIECPSCHWCGKNRMFEWWAKLSWNGMKRK